MCMWIVFVLLCVWNHAELWTRSIFERCGDTSHVCMVWAGGVTFVRPCQDRTSDTPKTSTDASTPGWLDVCYVTRRTYGASTNLYGRCLEATDAWRSPSSFKYRARGHWKVSRERSVERSVWKRTSNGIRLLRLSVGGLSCTCWW